MSITGVMCINSFDMFSSQSTNILYYSRTNSSNETAACYQLVTVLVYNV